MNNLLMNIPSEMKSYKQWICFAIENPETGKKGKIPVIPGLSNVRANISQPQNWRTYNHAISHLNQHDGLGFVFTKNDPFTGIDIDNCIDVKSNTYSQVAIDIIDLFNSYSEVSYSGTGIHIIIKASLPIGKNKFKLEDPEFPDMHIELYSQKRFFTVNGKRFRYCNSRIEDRQNELDKLYSKMSSVALLNTKSHSATQNSISTACNTYATLKGNIINALDLNQKIAAYKQTRDQEYFDLAYPELENINKLIEAKLLNNQELPDNIKIYMWGQPDKNGYKENLTLLMLQAIEKWDPNHNKRPRSFKNYYIEYVTIKVRDWKRDYIKLKPYKKSSSQFDSHPSLFCVDLESLTILQEANQFEDSTWSIVEEKEFFKSVLTPKQARVLELAIWGYKQDEVASKMGISLSMVEKYQRQIKQIAKKYFFYG